MPSKRKSAPAYETRSVDSLKAHPKQSAYFKQAEEHEIDELAEEIAAIGLKEPIEILRDGTVLSGHRRLKAAQQNGWTEVEVLVRYDLEGDNDSAEAVLIRANLVRQQLSPLQLARCYHRLSELSAASDSAERRRQTRPLEQLARRINMSSRNLQRYLSVAVADPLIQNAFDDGGLSLSQAEGLALLPSPHHKEALTALRGGESPKGVYARFCKSPKVGSTSGTALFSQLMDKLKWLAMASEIDLSEVSDNCVFDGQASILQSVDQFLKRLQKWHRQVLKRKPDESSEQEEFRQLLQSAPNAHGIQRKQG